MITQRFLSASFALLAASAAIFVASSASAQTPSCATDADCGHGFECNVYEAPCAGVDRPACAPGEECTVPEPVPCEPVTYGECRPVADCLTDTDCADGMVCYSQTRGDCGGTAPSAGGSEPGAADPAFAPPAAEEPVAPPPECITSTVTQCIPRYMLPCAAAADCGEGFTCVAEPVSCGCGSSGGGSDGAPLPGGTGGMVGGGEAPPQLIAPDDTCGCTPETQNVCRPVEIPCAMNVECPTGWLCKEVGGSETCSGATPAFDPADPGAPAEMPPPECTSVPGQLLCVPPYFDTIGGGGGVDRGESTSGQGGTYNGGTGGPATGAPPTSPDSLGNDVIDPDASSNDDGSCQMGSGNAGSSGAGASVLALLGLAGVLRRRRAA